MGNDDVRYAEVVDELRRSASELDSLLGRTSTALTRLTDCLSIVLAPSVLNLHIKQLSLVSLNPHRALVVLVTEDGQVFNRQMEFAEEVAAEDLAQVQRFLGDVFTGKTLHEIEDGLGAGMVEAFRDPLVRMALDEVLSCLQESSSSRARRLGVCSLLTKPEFSQSQALLPVMQVLEDDTVLLHILDDAAAGGGGGPRFASVGRTKRRSWRACPWSPTTTAGVNRRGIVAVIGPTRMDYSKVIRAVRIASSALEDV